MLFIVVNSQYTVYSAEIPEWLFHIPDSRPQPADIFAIGFQEMVELNAGNIVSARYIAQFKKLGHIKMVVNTSIYLVFKTSLNFYRCSSNQIIATKHEILRSVKLSNEVFF